MRGKGIFFSPAEYSGSADNTACGFSVSGPELSAYNRKLETHRISIRIIIIIGHCSVLADYLKKG